MKSNLVVLYHRMPYKEAMRNGKLVFLPNDKPNGIIPLLKSFFSLTDDAVWVAASELEEREELPASEKVPFFDQDGQCRVRRVFLSAEEIHAFYHRSCKEGFWPVLHAFPEKYNYGAVDWDNFESVNRRFAMAACEEVGEGGIIWIHDYNLWRAPYYIRKERPDAKVSFFFHTPFPPPDIFNILHWR